MSSTARKAATARYDAANTRQFKIKLNIRTDSDIIHALDNAGNIQGYIKRLIRQDISSADLDVNH